VPTAWVATREGDVLRRPIGDPLWPARYDGETLARRREELGDASVCN
jgi:hypothetical protein